MTIEIEHQLVLAECGAEPRHPKTYFDMDPETEYPPPCMYCASFAQMEAHAPCAHSHHWWFQQTGAFNWLVGKLYTSGAIAGSTWSMSAYCHGCRHSLSWRGKRPYVLFVRREWWECLRRGHLRGDDAGMGMCGKCLPCPECGSTKVGPFYSCADCGGFT